MDILKGADEEATMDRDQIDESPQVMDRDKSRDPAPSGNQEVPFEEGFIPLELLRKIADGEAPWPERQR